MMPPKLAGTWPRMPCGGGGAHVMTCDSCLLWNDRRRSLIGRGGVRKRVKRVGRFGAELGPDTTPPEREPPAAGSSKRRNAIRLSRRNPVFFDRTGSPRPPRPRLSQTATPSGRGATPRRCRGPPPTKRRRGLGRAGFGRRHGPRRWSCLGRDPRAAYGRLLPMWPSKDATAEQRRFPKNTAVCRGGRLARFDQRRPRSPSPPPTAQQTGADAVPAAAQQPGQAAADQRRTGEAGPGPISRRAATRKPRRSSSRSRQAGMSDGERRRVVDALSRQATEGAEQRRGPPARQFEQGEEALKNNRPVEAIEFYKSRRQQQILPTPAPRTRRRSRSHWPKPRVRATCPPAPAAGTPGRPPPPAAAVCCRSPRPPAESPAAPAAPAEQPVAAAPTPAPGGRSCGRPPAPAPAEAAPRGLPPLSRRQRLTPATFRPASITTKVARLTRPRTGPSPRARV